jgi:hypothetical protein
MKSAVFATALDGAYGKRLGRKIGLFVREHIVQCSVDVLENKTQNCIFFTYVASPSAPYTVRATIRYTLC